MSKEKRVDPPALVRPVYPLEGKDPGTRYQEGVDGKDGRSLQSNGRQTALLGSGFSGTGRPP